MAILEYLKLKSDKTDDLDELIRYHVFQFKKAEIYLCFIKYFIKTTKWPKLAIYRAKNECNFEIIGIVSRFHNN